MWSRFASMRTLVNMECMQGEQMRAWNVQDAVSEVRPGVFFVQGPASNWAIFTEAASPRFTLIDSGYPGDRELLLASMEHIGVKLADCAALLVTHGHSDHIGSAAFLAAQGIPVYAHELELANVRREVMEQITVKDLGLRALAPRVLAWAIHAIRAGGLSDVAVPSVQPLNESALVSLPGELSAVHTGGHTTGHTAYLDPKRGVLVCGDVLISGHAISPVRGPQLLPEPFHFAAATVFAAAAGLPWEDFTCLLPGHGPWLDLPEGLAAEGIRSGDYWPFGTPSGRG
ncbi:MBL fold metallo-hydrolase [Arthrobacter cryoconiti]|uniref:MBL fold metallo-hydrolase n=3 Tax=Arthrobacter cryoconiti TaxID=748907 RepID=A0ABV8R021_9MICC